MRAKNGGYSYVLRIVSMVRKSSQTADANRVINLTVVIEITCFSLRHLIRIVMIVVSLFSLFEQVYTPHGAA